MLTSPKKQEPSGKKPLDYLARYSIMGFQMGATIFLGAWGGIKIDEYFHTSFPVFTLVLICLAVFAAIYFVIKDLLPKKKQVDQ